MTEDVMTCNTSKRSSIRIPSSGTYTVNPERSTITFTTKPLFGLNRVTGRLVVASARIAIGDPVEASAVQATIDAFTFDSGNPRRDEMVRSAEFLGIDNWPSITFTSTGVRQDRHRWVIDGILTVRDRQAILTVIITALETDGPTITVHAKATVDRYAYGLTGIKGIGGRRVSVRLCLRAQHEPCQASQAPAGTTVPPAAALSVPTAVSKAWPAGQGGAGKPGDQAPNHQGGPTAAETPGAIRDRHQIAVDDDLAR